jgi:transcriptional regulator with XRE-family HTH domain
MTPRRRRLRASPPDPMYRHVGAAIRAAREVAGLTIEQLAAMLGVSRQAVTAWEAGRVTLGAHRLEQVAQATGCQARSLLPPTDHDAAPVTYKLTASAADLVALRRLAEQPEGQRP